jgi:hypothetical protein
MLPVCPVPCSIVQGPTALEHHLAIAEAAAGNAGDVARALLSAEGLLAREGRLAGEWLDAWQLPWRRWAGCAAPEKFCWPCPSAQLALGFGLWLLPSIPQGIRSAGTTLP